MEDNVYTKYFAINEQISILEISVRAIVMFLITFLVIRITGMRQFRKNSPFDMVIVFLIGGVLSRGVVGATPLFSAFVGGLILILLQKLLYKLSIKNKTIEKMLKGKKRVLYKDGQFIEDNMKKANITKIEVFEDLRVDLHCDNLDNITEIFVEKTGEISFVKK